MNLLNKYLSDEELNHIYETYDIEFINKIDEENFWKIISYLKQEKIDFINEIITDALYLFSLDYSDFAAKYEKIKETIPNYSKLIGYDMSLLEKIYE